MIKVKAIKPIPKKQNYCGLGYDFWIRLNSGEKMRMKKIPKLLKGIIIRSE